jgi:vacuole morphology and inheritance protein 14
VHRILRKDNQASSARPHLPFYMFLPYNPKDARGSFQNVFYNRSKARLNAAQKTLSVLCYTPISALMFCIIAGYFELSFNVLLNFGNVTLGVDYVAQFQIIINYIENHIANDLRMKLLEPLNNIDLVRTLYGILLILPQGVEYDMLSNRMKGIETLIEMSYDDYYRDEEETENEGDDNKKVIDELIACFNNTQLEIKKAMNEKEGG